jgi:hypothetical protein
MHPPQTRKFFAIYGIVKPGKRTDGAVRQIIWLREMAIKHESEDLDSGDCFKQGLGSGAEVWRQACTESQVNMQFKHPQKWKTWKVETGLEPFG